MSGLVAAVRRRATFPHGVHPREHKKLSADCPIEVLATPSRVEVPLLQHLGAPATAAVKSRDLVELGDVLGTADAFVSAPVHSPIAGKVAKLGVVTLANGRHVPTVPVVAGGDQLEGRALWDEVLGGDWPVEDLDRWSSERIVTAVRDAGIVGQGGAAFPTHVKLTPNPSRPVDTLVVNGCECEPYLTADDRVMREAPAAVVAGALLAARAAGAGGIVIGVEDNKPAAAAALAEAAAGTSVQVRKVRTKYPQGGERQLVLALLARVVPTGGLPLDVGVVVINVGTATAIARAVLRGKPVTHRVVTVTGRGVARPANLLAPIGAPFQALLDHCGGLRDDAARVLAGGPMMGLTLATLDTPITKGTSGFTILTDTDLSRTPETACVRCGRCAEVCPLDLLPTRIALAARRQSWDAARRYHITACIECGCCAFACPAAIPLTQLIRTGKAMLPRE